MTADTHSHHEPHRPGGWIGTLRSLFRPHHHDFAERVDQQLEASAEGIRAVKISLIGLLVTAALQVAVVIVSDSVALLSDTLHNFGDALTAIPLWLAFKIGRRQPNNRYTYGYGRLEDLAGIFVVLVIAISAGIAAYESVDRLIHPQPVRNLAFVLGASVVGFAGNELVAVYRLRVGRRIGSAALVADGLHARTDGLTSLAVFAGALGVAAGWELADPIVGLLITGAILIILKGAAVDIYHRLVDAVDPRLVDHVRNVLLGVPGIEAVDDVRIRWIGHELKAEAQVGVDRDLNVADGHAVAVKAHHELLHHVHRLTSAHIHVHPFPAEWETEHRAVAHHLGRHIPTQDVKKIH